MASRIELAQQYMGYQREQKTDEMLAMLAEDVVMNSPMTGTISGKEALAQQMRNRPMGGGGGGMNISWSEPEEESDSVKVVGSGSPFGPVKIVFTFNAEDKISKIEAGLAS